MGSVEMLLGYRYQSLPDLSGRRDPTHSRLSLTRTARIQLHEEFRRSNIGLQSVLRAAFAKVLLGYIESSEFLFADIRNTAENQDHLLALLRVNLSGCNSWVVFAQQVEKAGAYADISLESVGSSLGLPLEVNPLPARFVSGSLKDIVSAYSDGLLLLGIPESQIGGNPLSPSQDGELVELSVVCDSAIMSEPALQNFIEQARATAMHISANPTMSPASIVPLPSHLRSAYEEDYDSSRARVAVDWLMHNAATRPDAIAHEIYSTLEEPPVLLSYAELNSRSNMLANWFIEHGIQLEDKVAVCRTRDEHFYIANAALFKCGACYVSIDPELPLERRQFIVRDSGAKFVVTTASLAPDFGDAALVLENTATAKAISQQPSSNVCLAQLDSLAYLLYTSGTTGTPKGCLLNHRGLYWAIEAMCTYPRPITNLNTDKRLALASIAFDVHISEICQTWCLGIRLVSAPRYEILADLQGNLINLGITHAGMVPSMIEATLSGPDDLPLKYLVSGGEKISDSLLRKWANHPSLILANFYGPTEATIGCTSRLIRQTDRKENIGHPFPSCRAYVVDASMNVVPRGNPGELVVEGPLVGRGYHKLPEATAKAFKKWPTPDSNTYCTGDLVRMMPDDTIEIMGRIDTQIKLRGVRIESEGVSNVLRKASERPLDVATLIAKHPDSGSELLVSFVAFGDRQISVTERRSGHVELAHDFPPILMESLKSMAARELAVYMRPSHIIPVIFLPLSLNMKADTKLLAEFFRTTPISTLLAVQRERKVAEPPLSPQKTGSLDADQHSVAEIVSRLSNTPFAQIRADSNLLECGMDSLKLSALARELRKLWVNSRIAVTDILAAPVLSNVAMLRQGSSRECVERADSLAEFDRTWRATAESMFRPEDIEAVLPTFPVQEGVLFQALVSPTQYVQHFIYRIKEPVENTDLHRSWTEAIRQHPILRTAFLVEDIPLQVLLHPEAVQVPLATYHQPLRLKSASFPSWFLESEKDRIAVEINGDLTTPTFRVNIYELEDRFMVVSLSHAIYDGVALPSLMKSVDGIIVGDETSEVVPLQPLLESIRTSHDNARQFWVEKFDHLDLKRLSPRRPANPQVQYARRVFSTITYKGMQHACRTQHTTLQALGCASYALAGRDSLGWRDNAIFGIIRSGRSLPVDGVETAVVPLVSLVPFVLAKLSMSSMDVLSNSQAELTTTLAFEHTPLGNIQRWLGVPLLFETLFSCRVEEGRVPYKSFEHCETKAPLTEFILSVEMLANSRTNTIEVKAAFTDELHTGQVEDLLSSIERYFQLLARGELIPSPSSEAVEITQETTQALGIESNKPQHTGSRGDELLKTLVPVVASFLHAEPHLVTPDASLVSLGLTSLKAVALSRRLKDIGIFVSPIDIIQTDIIDQVVLKCEVSSTQTSQLDANPQHTQWLDTLRQELIDELDVTSLKLSEDDELQITGATALQAGMLSQTVSSEDRLYVHGFTFKLRSDCSLEKLKSSWRQTIKDIGTLRTSFAFSENTGRWAQVVHSEFELPWVSREFKEPSSALSEFISDLPFTDIHDFRRPPLHLCHFNVDDYDYLLVVLHHALYDGISLPLLFHRVRSIYHGINPLSSVSFHDLVPQILIQEHFGTSYWVKRLAGASVYTFPRTSNTSAGAWRSSAECQVELAEIQRTCRRYQVNVQCFGQAAMAKLLAQLSEQTSVVFGQVISGRTLPGAEEVIGPVFNTIPCHIDLSLYRTYGDLLRGVQRANNEGLSYQHASLRSIQRELGVKTVIDALFLFQPNVPIQSTGLHPIWDPLEHAGKDETKTQYGLNIELHQSSSGFTIRASCSAAVMGQPKLKELLSKFGEILYQVVTCPSTPIHTQHDAGLTSAKPNHGLKTPAPPVTQTTHTAAYSSEFDGWTVAQMKFRDLLVAFTKIPASNIQPSSQLATLGLDSISSIQLASMAKRAGIKLSAADVARSTTLADVAVIIARNSELPEPSNKRPVPPPSRPLLDDHVIAQARQVLPASLQDAVELFAPITPGMNFILSSWVRSGGWRFQHAFTFKVAPSVDSSRLHHAWDKLVERHAILRSIFVALGDQTVLCVLEPGSIRTPWNEVIADGSVDDLEEVGKIARQTVGNPPLLRNGPAARLTYMRGEKGDYLILEMHHALYDAWSFNMILRDLEDLYLGNTPADRNDLGHLVNAIASQENTREQRAYWETALQGFQPSLAELSTNAPSTSHQLFGLASVGELVKHVPIPFLFSMGTFQAIIAIRPSLSRAARLITGALAATGACLSALALVQHSSPGAAVSAGRTYCVFRDLVFGFGALNKLSMEWGLPLHMVLLACWARVQARRSGNGDQGVVFGLLHNGRGLDGTDDIAAPCINVLPVYIRNPLREDASTVAKSLHTDLKSRSAVVQQSRLQDIGTWVGTSGKPLFHYFVNMLKVPSASGQNKALTGILERIKVPNNPVATRNIEPNNTFGRSLNPAFEAMSEVQDDCMIEVFFDSKRDSIGMEVTCKSTVLSRDQARELANEWGQEVLNTFRSRSVVA
ncbi:Non-ribosomal peptide synthetase [Ceratobasidium sp. 423]|nr:Non-ribosomal peptide synthetase [Ceratobasidium sp. 423]